jgi:predicted permease
MWTLLHRGKADAETREELEYHVARQTEKHVRAGIHPDEARRLALIELGGLRHWRSETADARRGGLLFGVWADARYAVRGLRARPLFSATIVATIALGMGANATMFGIIDRLLFRGPAQIRDSGSVAILETSSVGDSFRNTSFSYAAYTDFRDHPGGFSSVAVVSRSNAVPLGRGRDASRVSGVLSSASFFPTVGVRPALGRFFTRDEDDEHDPQDVAVIGYGFWQQHFGGRRDALGAVLDIGTQRFRVVGVAPNGFTGVDFNNVDVWLPISAASGLRFDSSPTWTTNRGNTWLTIVARIKPGVSTQVATEQATAAHRTGLRAQIDANPGAARWIKPDSELVHLASLVPGKMKDGNGTSASQQVEVSRLLGIVSFVVLIIACANVANLLLVRGFNRRREVAVRLALGVGRRRLIVHLLMEGLVLAVLGAVGALLIAHWTSQAVRTLLLGQNAWTTDAVDGRLLIFTGVMTIVTGVLTSLVPALAASRTDVSSALKAGAREGGGQHSPVRSALLVVQAALALVLLAGSGLFIRSVKNVNALPIGLDVNHVLVADISHKAAGLSNAEAHRLFERFESEVRHVPGVTASAVSIGLPFALNWTTKLSVPGRTLPKLQQNPAQYAVTPDYFTTLGIPLVAGRSFATTDRAGTVPVVIINAKAAALYFPQRNAVGECVKVGDDTMPCATIVGVVANTVRQGLEDIVPQVYRPLDQLPESFTDHTVSFFGYELVARTNGDAARYVDAVRRAMQSVSATVPYANVRPMRDLFGSRIRTWELGAKVFTAFGMLALVLAGLGLYSVLAFSLAQRAHEFGVRIALGASSADLVRLSVSKGLVPIVVGMVVGLGLALLSGPLVESLLFNVSAHDTSILGSVCAILLGTAVVASLVPALRVSRVNPASVLRTD